MDHGRNNHIRNSLPYHAWSFHLTHRKNLGKAIKKLDQLKKTDRKAYRRKEISLNKKLRKLKLI
jgi:hypothetical protein